MAVAECGRGRYTGTSPIVTSCSQEWLDGHSSAVILQLSL